MAPLSPKSRLDSTGIYALQAMLQQMFGEDAAPVGIGQGRLTAAPGGITYNRASIQLYDSSLTPCLIVFYCYRVSHELQL